MCYHPTECTPHFAMELLTHAPCVLPMQRILQVNYTLPPQVCVSHECQDLMRRILVASPEKRISISQILVHPWFVKDLPEGVAEMNQRLIPPEGHEFDLPPGIQASP